MKIIGYKKFTTKKGEPCTVAVCVTEFSERELNNGCRGQKVEEIYMPKDKLDFLKPEHIGHELIPQYSISYGRAYLTDVTIK